MVKISYPGTIPLMANKREENTKPPLSGRCQCSESKMENQGTSHSVSEHYGLSGEIWGKFICCGGDLF